MTSPPLSHFLLDDRRLACRIREGTGPTMLFLPGYASDMDGGKATAIDALAAERGLPCIRFDYSGTGLSDGAFADGTLSRWLDEALAILDAKAQGPVIPIGSSMGGWLALLIALRRPDRVAGVMGIAAAPDFTDWGFTQAQKDTIRADGKLEEPNPYGPEPYVTHKGFWESGEQLRLLDGDIDFSGPARFVHGDKDQDVPVSIALKAMRQLKGTDIQLKLIKHGGHRLSEPHEIAAILTELVALVETVTP
ncbi:alpha/beta fold hydrolase [Sphingomicrobium marinum]|uniref:alpha/beta fold hydrolase n=1 Tax=Sphingomicrobium marinum TaxID=1227950 RepID=UPI002240B55C|nr:alpha/beta hydrolase [Sphingomicrobium marinum]